MENFSKSLPLPSPLRPTEYKVAAPLEPVVSKYERKTRERWRNAEVSTWLEREKKREFRGYNEIFEMEP